MESRAAGLSPPARGNRQQHIDLAHVPGPIPASAGEPAGGGETGEGHGAYPRQRGGTGTAADGRQIYEGLSPPARGNLDHQRVCGQNEGPIPASAGEPSQALGAR